RVTLAPEWRCITDRTTMAAADLAGVRLFLTTRGDPVTQRMFRSAYWNPALRAAGIVAPPHIARHWFVTNALRTIERTARDQNEMVRRNAELVQRSEERRVGKEGRYGRTEWE